MVHLGPNVISISDPAEIQKIYGFGNDFVKLNPQLTVLPCPR